MRYICENDYQLIDAYTGKRTLWGFWDPPTLLSEPSAYSERLSNSVEILSWLVAANTTENIAKTKQQQNKTEEERVCCWLDTLKNRLARVHGALVFFLLLLFFRSVVQISFHHEHRGSSFHFAAVPFNCALAATKIRRLRYHKD